MTNIIPASQSNSNYFRVGDAIAGMLGMDFKAFQYGYKFYDDELYLLKALSPSQSQYEFNPVKGLDSTVGNSNLMDKSDLFAVTGIGLVFTRATYNSTTASLSAFGNQVIYTYPYVSVFSGSNEQAGLLNIVNGTVSLAVSGDQQWNIPARRMVYANQYINAQPTTVTYGPNDGGQGILNLNSIVVLDGENQNVISVNLATGGTLTNIDGNTNATTRNLLGVRLVGFRIRNLAGGRVGNSFSNTNCRV